MKFFLSTSSVFLASLLSNEIDAQQTASTTRYWDCSGGACGCGFGSSSNPYHCYSNGLFAAPAGNPYGATYYGTAAVSETLGGGYWLAQACGTCWQVTGTSSITQATTTLVLMGANFCPPSNAACANGNAHFDIAAPGFDFLGASQSNVCSGTSEAAGFASCGLWMIASQNPSENCNCNLFNDPVLRTGCQNFLNLAWNNEQVTYQTVTCPTELTRIPCWEDNGNQWPSNPPQFCATNVDNNNPPPPVPPSPTPPPTPAPIPSPTPPPTLAPIPPPTPAPTPAPIPPSGGGGGGNNCCTHDLATCNESSWCNQSQGNCEGSCNGYWFDVTSCASDELTKWQECTNTPTKCCGPLSCVGDSGYSQCL